MASSGSDSGNSNFEDWRAPTNTYTSFTSASSVSDTESPSTTTSGSDNRSVLSASSEVEISRGCTHSCQTVDNDNDTSTAAIFRVQQNTSDTPSDIVDGFGLMQLSTPQQVPIRSSARIAARVNSSHNSSDSSVPEVNVPQPPSPEFRFSELVQLPSPASSPNSINSGGRSTPDSAPPSTAASSNGIICTPTSPSSSSNSGDQTTETSSSSSSSALESDGPIWTTSAETVPSIDRARDGGDLAGTNGAISDVGTVHNNCTSEHGNPSSPVQRPGGRSSTPNSALDEPGLVGPAPNISNVEVSADSPLARNFHSFSLPGVSIVDGNPSPPGNNNQVVPNPGTSGSSSGDSSSSSETSSVSSVSDDSVPFAIAMADYINRYYVPRHGPIGQTSVETVIRRLHLAAISDTPSNSSSSSSGSSQHSNSNHEPIVTSPPATPGGATGQFDGNAALIVSYATGTESANNDEVQPNPPAQSAPTDQNRTPPARNSPGAGPTPLAAPTLRRSPRMHLSSTPSNSAAGNFPDMSTSMSAISEREAQGTSPEVPSHTQDEPTANVNFDILKVYPTYFELKSGFSVPKRSFKLLCSALIRRHQPGFRFSATAVESLQTAAEDFIVKMFESAFKITRVRKSTTTAAKDMRTAVELQEPKVYNGLPPLEELQKKYKKRKAQKPVKLFESVESMSLD